jgi:hypothetical protein
MSSTETEPDVIARVLDEHRVRDSSYVAQRIHSALIRRRLAMLTEDLERRTKEGLA